MQLTDLTIVIPVYGESVYLGEALQSTEKLVAKGASLLIIDDGATTDIAVQINSWVDNQDSDCIRVTTNPNNLGLFMSLNQNLQFVRTKWFCFLCSDDFLLPDIIRKLQSLHPNDQTGLILSKFRSVNADRSIRYDDCKQLDALQSKYGNILSSNQILLALLRYGSINGNLSGMLIRNTLWQACEGFLFEWKHAADWEWLVRACEKTTTRISLLPLVALRTHADQLSFSNQGSGAPLLEAIAVIKILQKKTNANQNPLAMWWSASLLQHHLWNQLLSNCRTRNLSQLEFRCNSMKQVAPLYLIFAAMIFSLPGRITRRAMMKITKLRSKSSFGESLQAINYFPPP